MDEEARILCLHMDVGRYRSKNEDSFLALQGNGEEVCRLGMVRRK